MTNKSGQAGNSPGATAKMRRQSAVWIVVIGIVFVIVLWILLQNSKTLEIGGIGILLLLVLLRVVPGIIDKQAGKKGEVEQPAISGEQEDEKDQQAQNRD